MHQKNIINMLTLQKLSVKYLNKNQVTRPTERLQSFGRGEPGI